jgi:hypothetical protein
LLQSAICFCGGALVECGHAKEGVARLREGLAALYASGLGIGSYTASRMAGGSLRQTWPSRRGTCARGRRIGSLAKDRRMLF